MKEDKKLVPKLRFPEFREATEWEEQPLARVCNVFQGYGFPEVLQGKRKGKYPFCKVSDISRAVAENGGFLTSANNYVDNDELLKLRAKLIPKGATVFAKIGEALRLNRRAYVQSACLIDNNATGLKAIGGVADDYFVYLLSQLIDLNRHCGGAVPSVNKSTLEEIEVIVPGPAEQKRIADCLSSLDELIAAQARKVDTLKTHKKGLIQQLFPREGETQPRLRFPEFRDSEEWEVKKLEDLAKRGSGHTPSKSSSEYYDGGIKWVSLADSKYLDAGLISTTKIEISKQGIKNSSAVLHPAGTVLISRDAGVGKSAIMQIPMAVSQHFIVWTCNHSLLSNWFLYYLLQKMKPIFERIATGSTIKTIGLPFFKELSVSVPTLPEQQRIADCLNSLDDLITAQTQELDTLKTHKKGLMQQLFPSAEAVEA